MVGQQTVRKTSRRTVALWLLAGALSLSYTFPFKGEEYHSIFFRFGPLVVSPIDIYAVGIATALVFHHREIRFPASTEHRAYLLFLCATLLSIVLNGAGVGGAVELAQWIEMLVLAVCISYVVTTDDDRRVFIWALVLFGVLKALWSLSSLFLYGMTKSRLFAELEGLALVFCVGLLIKDRIRPRLVVITTLLTIGVIASQERKVWIAVAAAVAATMVLSTVISAVDDGPSVRSVGRYALVIGAPLASVVAATFFSQDIYAGIRSLQGLLDNPRIYIYETSFNMWVHNPLFGVGPDNWYSAKPIYMTDGLHRWEQRYDADALKPHSIYFRILSEYGVVAFAGFMYFVLSPLRSFSKLSEFGDVDLSLALGYVYVLVIAGTTATSAQVRAPVFVLLGLYYSRQVSGAAADDTPRE